MKKIIIRAKRLPHAEDIEAPAHMSHGASGMDLRAACGESVVLAPGKWKLIPTGLMLSIPAGFEAQVRPRSGLALKYGITCLNSPGTIDSDYRGEINVILINLSDAPFVVERGMRIAQMIFSEVTQAQLEFDVDLDATTRGSGGFGHTGV
ncbi:MAG: dUTP diphosphatase [Candidatus Omnitrophica bacterium]|nr:dUTP diphosphatase [Candidatus Omnitrophota bacterium]